MTTGTDELTPLRRAREARGLRVKDLASVSGLSARTVSNAELSRHEPHPSSKTVIARALEMDPRELWPPDDDAGETTRTVPEDAGGTPEAAATHSPRKVAGD